MGPRVARAPHAWEATVSANNLRSHYVFPQRRQRLTSCGYREFRRLSYATYVTAHSDSRHRSIDEPHYHEDVGETGLPLAMLHVKVEAEGVVVVGVGRLPGCGSWHESGHVGGIGFVSIRKPAGDIGSFALH